jgi:hypothetical protein
MSLFVLLLICSLLEGAWLSGSGNPQLLNVDEVNKLAFKSARPFVASTTVTQVVAQMPTWEALLCDLRSSATSCSQIWSMLNMDPIFAASPLYHHSQLRIYGASTYSPVEFDMNGEHTIISPGLDSATVIAVFNPTLPQEQLLATWKPWVNALLTFYKDGKLNALEAHSSVTMHLIGPGQSLWVLDSMRQVSSCSFPIGSLVQELRGQCTPSPLKPFACPQRCSWKPFGVLPCCVVQCAPPLYLIRREVRPFAYLNGLQLRWTLCADLQVGTILRV